ncbi:MAG: arsenate reductase (glutaredoxin), partial [Alphaproteobacteria bacterium]|nr:arsenate reductase (glutaredoxin) [Alphaproteobacteria bacterium]
LQEHGIQPTIIEYLETPPSAKKLGEILVMLGLRPRELMRNKEDVYAASSLDNPNLSDDDLIEAMVKHPILIERPIILANDKATIGRPPEQVLEII